MPWYRYPLDRWLGEPQSRSWSFGEETNLEPRFLGYPVRTLDTIPTATSRLLLWNRHEFALPQTMSTFSSPTCQNVSFKLFRTYSIEKYYTPDMNHIHVTQYFRRFGDLDCLQLQGCLNNLNLTLYMVKESISETSEACLTSILDGVITYRAECRTETPRKA
jgi:hypothetical protein